MAATAQLPSRSDGHRSDEARVRLVFVQHCAEYAALVRETLESTARCRFEVRHASQLEAARLAVESDSLDAVLVDGTGSGGEGGRVSIDEASHLATRVPVIVLTGSERESGEPEAEAEVFERIAHSRLPDEILNAVRRHQRLGPRGGADPIVLRDPLRACARVFARLRRKLAGTGI